MIQPEPSIHNVPVISESPYQYGSNIATSSSTSTSASALYSRSSQMSNGSAFSPNVSNGSVPRHHQSGTPVNTNIVLQNNVSATGRPHSVQHHSPQITQQSRSGTYTQTLPQTLGTTNHVNNTVNAVNTVAYAQGYQLAPRSMATTQQFQSVGRNHPMSCTMPTLPSIQSVQSMMGQYPQSMRSSHSHRTAHCNNPNANSGVNQHENVNVNLNHTINLNHNVTHNINLNAPCFNNLLPAQQVAPAQFAQFAVNFSPITLRNALSSHPSHPSHHPSHHPHPSTSNYSGSSSSEVYALYYFASFFLS